MDFINQYFSLCELPFIKNSCVIIPFLFCIFNTIIFFIFFMLLVFKIAYHLVRYLRRNPTLSLKKSFHKSIFTYIWKTNPYQSYALYFLMSYGIFFTRPLGFIIIYFFLPSFVNIDPTLITFFLTFLTSLTNTLYFFTMIFMINFYGIKAEIMRDKGDPSISVDERELFLKMVVQRSATFSLIFFGGSMLNIVFGNAVFGNDAFGMPGKNVNLKYEWALRAISYGFLTILLINRLNYMRYTRKMAEDYSLQKKNAYNLISISRLMEEHSFLPETLPSLLTDIGGNNEELFLLDFQTTLLKKKRQASFILNETRKILHNGNVAYQPILRNPMENYVGGVLWIIVTLLDTVFNLIASPLFILISQRDDTILKVLAMIMFIFYILETTLQSYLTSQVVGSKENFGDHLDVRGRGASELTEIILGKEDLVDSYTMGHNRLSAIETMTPNKDILSKNEL